MPKDAQFPQIVSATPLIDPAFPYAAQLTIATDMGRTTFVLSRALLSDLALQISAELERAPLPERRGANLPNDLEDGQNR
jgi:hypothetical protein